MAGGAFGVTGLLMVLFFWFSPIGFEKLILPVPYFSSPITAIIYFPIALAAFAGLLSFTEMVYYLMFLEDEMRINFPNYRKFVMAASYGVYKMALVSNVVFGFFPRLVFGLWLGGIFLGLHYVMKKYGIVQATAVRIGISLSAVVWIIYLGLTRQNTLSRKQPKFFFPAYEGNIFGSS